jgi:hypothetical protein
MNFRGVFDYNPTHDPLVGLSRDEAEDLAFDYMAMWISDEDEADEFSRAYAESYELVAAHFLCQSGAIDSEHCYPNCRNIERIIEGWAEAFRALNEAEQERLIEAALGE